MVRTWLSSLTLLALLGGGALAQAPLPVDYQAAPAAPVEEPVVQPVSTVLSAEPAHFPPTTTPLVTGSMVPLAVPAATEPCAAAADCAHGSSGQIVNRFWVDAEYLLWWIKDTTVPPTIGTVPTGLVASGAALPSGAINPAFGGLDRLDYFAQSGFRISGGVWIDDARDWGVEGNYFQLGKANHDFLAGSPGDPIIGPLYFDPVQAREVILLFSSPAGINGLDPRSAVLTAHADNHLWGAEFNVSHQIPAVFFADRLDFLVGIRHLQFGEGLEFDGTSIPSPGANPRAPSITFRDTFTALNQFYGGQVGLRSHHEIYDIFTLDVVGKLAFGGIVETAKVNGATTLSNPITGVRSFQTGILAEPTNTGTFSRGRTCWLPELNITGGVRLTSWARLTVGYDFLLVDQLIRAGDQINPVDSRVVQSSANFTPGSNATQPVAPNFRDTRFWAQGLNLGMEFTY